MMMTMMSAIMTRDATIPIRIPSIGLNLYGFGLSFSGIKTETKQSHTSVLCDNKRHICIGTIYDTKQT